MDGDAADLPGLLDLRKQHPFVLVLDEAHGSGVYGPCGAGYAAHLNCADQVDITLVTLSKALGLAGGAICASQVFCDAVCNFGRAYIFSTIIPPAIAAGVRAALHVLQTEPDRQQRVRENARRLRSQLGIGAGDCPIVPVILESAQRALDASQALRDEGFLVPAVRPPTVPPNSSRLRITLSSEHSTADIDALASAVNRLRQKEAQ
jgi:8-amino-7-oxononanoate synthase